MPGVPGALASLAIPGAAAAAAAGRLGFPTLSSGHCVMLVSNLNPEVSNKQNFLHVQQVVQGKVRIQLDHKLLF